jgi:hypothetical protein
MTRYFRLAALGMASVGAAAMLSLSPSAHASSSPATTAQFSATVSKATPHCGAVITHSGVGQERCSSSQAALAAVLTDSTSTVVSIDYSDANFQGSTFTWWTSGIFSCSGFPDFSSNMFAGWNDIVSSYKDFANCNNNPHYENTNENQGGGALVNCGPTCSYVGNALNDRTSSESWGSF